MRVRIKQRRSLSEVGTRFLASSSFLAHLASPPDLKLSRTLLRLFIDWIGWLEETSAPVIFLYRSKETDGRQHNEDVPPERKTRFNDEGSEHNLITSSAAYTEDSVGVGWSPYTISQSALSRAATWAGEEVAALDTQRRRREGGRGERTSSSAKGIREDRLALPSPTTLIEEKSGGVKTSLVTLPEG